MATPFVMKAALAHSLRTRNAGLHHLLQRNQAIPLS
jgi:hypothetical protein